MNMNKGTTSMINMIEDDIKRIMTIMESVPNEIMIEIMIKIMTDGPRLLILPLRACRLEWVPDLVCKEMFEWDFLVSELVALVMILVAQCLEQELVALESEVLELVALDLVVLELVVLDLVDQELVVLDLVDQELAAADSVDQELVAADSVDQELVVLVSVDQEQAAVVSVDQLEDLVEALVVLASVEQELVVLDLVEAVDFSDKLKPPKKKCKCETFIFFVK